MEEARKLLRNRQEVKEQEEKATVLLQLAFDHSASDWMQERINTCKAILENASIIKDWIVYRQFAREAREAGLTPICDAYEDGLSNDDVMNVYMKSIYKSIVLYVIKKEPALNGFTGLGLNERIQQFKKLDQEFMELTKEEMY